MATTAAQSVVAIVSYGDFDKSVASVIDTNQDMQQLVGNYEKQYLEINVASTLSRLATVSCLVEVAYMGTKGHKSNAPVSELMMKYHTLVHDSSIACTTFYATSKDALGLHRMALLIASRHMPDVVFQTLSSISSKAFSMSELAGKLETKAGDLCKLIEDAFVQASNDNTQVNDMNRLHEIETNNLTSKSKMLTTKTKSLTKQLQDACNNEAKAADDADTARTQAFAINMAGVVCGALSNVAGAFVAAKTLGINIPQLQKNANDDKAPAPAPPSFLPQSPELAQLIRDLAEERGNLAMMKHNMATEEDAAKKKQWEGEVVKLEAKIQSLVDRQTALDQASAVAGLVQQKNNQADSAAQREQEFRAERIKLQEQEREASAELAESLEKLKGMSIQQSQLATALQSLDLAHKALGQIKVIYENTREYWAKFGHHCKALQDKGEEIKKYNVEGLEEVLEEAIMDSWCSWVALAKTNYAAGVAIQKVKKTADNLMNDIPTTEEIKKRMHNQIETLQSALKKNALEQ